LERDKCRRKRLHLKGVTSFQEPSSGEERLDQPSQPDGKSNGEFPRKLLLFLGEGNSLGGNFPRIQKKKKGSVPKGKNVTAKVVQTRGVAREGAGEGRKTEWSNRRGTSPNGEEPKTRLEMDVASRPNLGKREIGGNSRKKRNRQENLTGETKRN